MVLTVKNETPYTYEQIPMMDLNGATILRGILKAAFRIQENGHLLPASDHPRVLLEDEYWGEVGRSAIKREADMALPRPYTDLLVVGHACAPNHRPVQAVDVGLMYQDRLLKHLRVSGDRYWFDRGFGWSMTDPEPFERMPVSYDRAYGGMDEHGSEARNRVGRGYTSKLTLDYQGRAAANVEDLNALISSPKQRPAPAGLGVIHRDWEPRLPFAGTYDTAYLEDRHPLLPRDFDLRFNQTADPKQWLARPKGGERVAISSMHPSGVLWFHLPDPTVNIGFFYHDRADKQQMALESVLVDTDNASVELTWRASADIHGDPFQLLETVISFGDPKRRCGAPDCDGC